MRTSTFSGIRAFLLLFVTLVFLTGCTLFDRGSKHPSAEDNMEQLVQEKTRTGFLEIVDKNSETKTFPLSFIEGENIYEILNRENISREDLVIEFDYLEFDDEEQLVISTINEYNPAVDNMTWVLQINGRVSREGLLETRPGEGDTIRIELEKTR